MSDAAVRNDHHDDADAGHTHAHEGHGAHSHSDQGRGHAHPGGVRGRLAAVFRPHSHDASDSVDAALGASARGIRAVQVSLAGLGATALFQVVIVVISGSVALLADTIHNFSDALTAIPLWIAFSLGRRAASRRYTYGFGRAEDMAGLFIVLMIAASAALAGWESTRRLLDPRPVENVGWVLVAAVVGFLGNEAVALYRIRVGRQIGSAALVADGYHARTDGLTSLAVLGGAVGALLGFRLADPLVGLAITVAILFVLRDAATQIWRRLMDASDPGMIERFEREAGKVAGVQAVGQVRARWLGHRLETDVHVQVDEDLSTRDSHAVAEAVRHALFHAEPKLATVVVHVDPCGHAGTDPHDATAHHAPAIGRRAPVDSTLQR